MTFSGRHFDPTAPPAPTGPVVDYALARRSVIASVRRSALGPADVCDAHPELLRAGRNVGEEIDEPCPICSCRSLRWVRYVYGDELKRNNGRVVYPADWLKELALEHDQFTCYVVEVCLNCCWNHLIRSHLAGRRFSVTNGRRAPRRERG